MNHHNEFNQLFASGLKRHGQNYRIAHRVPTNAELVVFWGHRQKELIEQQKNNGGDYLVAERGYVGDRMKWTSLGYNGLNGRAEFHSSGKDTTRWQRYHGDKLKPWRIGGDYVLIMGQVHGDSSIEGIDIDQWAAEIFEQCKFDVPVYFRPHPLSRQRAPKQLTVMNGNLTSALNGARAVITYNSNSGVDAVISGVPTIATDRGSMAWNVASRTSAWLRTPNRTQWAAELAWCQWLPEEIKNGDAWDHLKQRYA